MPEALPPDCDLVEAEVTLVESLPPGAVVEAQGGGAVIRWWEHVDGAAPARIYAVNGQKVLAGERIQYLAGWPDDTLWDRILLQVLAASDVDILKLPDGVRVRDTQSHRFVFNYGPLPAQFDGHEIGTGDFLCLPL